MEASSNFTINIKSKASSLMSVVINVRLSDIFLFKWCKDGE